MNQKQWYAELHRIATDAKFHADYVDKCQSEAEKAAANLANGTKAFAIATEDLRQHLSTQPEPEKQEPAA